MKHLADAEVSSWTRKLFDKVRAGLGTMPDLFRAMANSEDVFEGFLNLNASLANAEIGPKFVKMVILRTSELNDCEYCVRAHTKMAADANLMSPEECLNARKGIGSDEKSQALLDFVTKVHQTKGNVTDEDIERMHKAGFSDKNIVEILGAMTVATMTNILSHVAGTEPDFPEVPPAK